MKAAVYKSYGPPEVVQIQQVEKPVPKDNEVLIKIHATTVNRTDCGFRSAEYFISRFFSGLIRPNYGVLGNEFSGEIESIGKNVTSFNPADAVFGYDDTKFGAHAEYKVIDESGAITTIPRNLSYAEAAAITEGAHYALGNIRAAKIREGQNWLINGATGAIGSAAVQLVTYFGAKVTAVCHGDHIGLVKSLGANKVIDYTKDDFTRMNESFDVIFDAVGKSSFGKCKPLLKEKGIYMSTELGNNAQNPFLAIITPLLGGKKVLFPIPTISKKDILFLKELIEADCYKPVIDKSYPFEQIVEAHTYVETGYKTGNVVITMA